MLADLIQTHGYWVLAIGCLLEGETVLILAGFAAHRGYLDPWLVLAIAAGCGVAGDQFYFWLGRRHGAALLARWPALARHTARVDGLLARFHAPVIIGVRFAYGLRVAGPVAIGMSALPAGRFVVFNALGALLWACIFTGAGWVFGEVAQRVLGEIRHLEGWLLLGLAVAGLLYWMLRRFRTRRRISARSGAQG
jgi:membrane protein DedA with SNARE-associated domain